MTTADEIPSPLAFVTIDEILDELEERYDCVVLTCIKDRTEDTEERLLQWRGSPTMASGLVRIADRRLYKCICEASEEAF